MEAADDIAYCLSDLEDGIEKNILSKNDLQELLTRMEVCNNDSISWFVVFFLFYFFTFTKRLERNVI